MTTQEHLRAAARNLETMAEEINLIASDDEPPCDHMFADEFDSEVNSLMEFAMRVV